MLERGALVRKQQQQQTSDRRIGSGNWMGCFGVTTTCRRQEVGQDCGQQRGACQHPASPAAAWASHRVSCGRLQAGWKLLCTHPAAERRTTSIPQYNTHHRPCCNTTFLAARYISSAASCCIHQRIPSPPASAIRDIGRPSLSRPAASN